MGSARSDAAEMVVDYLLESKLDLEDALANLRLPLSSVDLDDLQELWRCPACRTWIHADDRDRSDGCYCCP